MALKLQCQKTPQNYIERSSRETGINNFKQALLKAELDKLDAHQSKAGSSSGQNAPKAKASVQ